MHRRSRVAGHDAGLARTVNAASTVTSLNGKYDVNLNQDAQRLTLPIPHVEAVTPLQTLNQLNCQVDAAELKDGSNVQLNPETAQDGPWSDTLSPHPQFSDKTLAVDDDKTVSP
jgi:hypothetical protein